MFEYISGDLAADFVNAGDQITNYDQLLEWAEGAGAVPDGESLRALARLRSVEAPAVVDAAHRLQAIIRVAFGGEVTGLNTLLARVMPRRQLEGNHWVWVGADQELESPLWPVILAAANLVTSPDMSRLRVCADADCGWFFVDRSRNGLRRWCSMADCGTKAKSRRRALKQSASVARRAP